ncbi:MAG TPA: hypothetical protein VMP11_12435 [Verrucomicrobiae bacterium]|nr:hypothetical protein [Verrucomicrobiae bacterium]
MNDDGELRRLFQDLRAGDTQQVPAFSRVAQPPVTEASFGILWPRLAAGVALIAAVSMSLILFRAYKGRSADVTQQWAALSNWRASTDELLSVSGAATWGGAITTPSDLWLEDVDQPTQKKAL